MKNLLILIGAAFFLFACESSTNTTESPAAKSESTTKNFKYVTEKFADLQMIRYQIPGFEKLTLDQKKLVYFLSQAGLSGRDIIYDQNYKYNLKIRTALENVLTTYQGDKSSEDWENFTVYLKRIWFSNGIHHHYGMEKIMPDFSRTYFESLLSQTSTSLDSEIVDVIFDPELDNKKVNLDESKGLIAGSATNFYGEGITADDVDAYYESIIVKGEEDPISYGLNSKLVRDENGDLKEEVWKVGGMYGEALEESIKWLELAVGVAENDAQKKGLELLIEYYQTGDLKTWDEYNIVWAGATEGDIDYILGFVEVYNDPKGYRGSYESIIEINDFDASARMSVLQENVQ